MLYNVKAVLFDLEVVIVFTERLHFSAWKRLASEQGWRFDQAIHHQLRGMCCMDSLGVILSANGISLSRTDRLNLAGRKNGYYADSLAKIKDDSLYPGVIPFIRSLKARGLLIGLCSDSCNAAMVVDRLGIEELFDCIVTCEDVTKPKPDPEIFEKAAKRLNRHPFNCMVFEHTISGIDAAKNGDFRHVGFSNTGCLLNADQIISDYASIDIDSLIEFGRIQPPEVNGWRIISREFTPSQAQYWESLFCLSNGYMGVRGALEEESVCMANWTHPGCYINGIYETIKFPGHREFPGELDKMDILINLFDWRLITVEIDGESMSLDQGRFLEHYRELNMKDGVLNRALVWESSGGKQVRIESVRLVSMVRRHSAAIRYRVIPLNFSGRIDVISSVGGVTGSIQMNESVKLRHCRSEIIDGDTIFICSRTELSNIDIGLSCAHGVGSGEVNEIRISQKKDVVKFRYRFDSESGKALHLDKHVALTTSLDTDDVAEMESVLLKRVRKDRLEGFDSLLREQKCWWRQAWGSMDIQVRGCDADQQAIRLSIFQLRQNHTKENKRSISATGTSGDNYHGWIFWDTEVFMFPFFLYHDPVAARALLEYRCNTLDGARRRAREIQLPGACYGWSTLDGTENNGYFAASTAQYHVNADIGYAMWHYFQATQDFDFIVTSCIDTLVEICRMFAGLGKFIKMKGNRFCINYVCGPDEYNYHVNNNCFTNLMVQKHINFTLEILDCMSKKCPTKLINLKKRVDLSEEEIVIWRRIEKEMFIPFNNELCIHEQDDGFLYRDPVDVDMLPDNYEFKKSFTELNLGRMQVCKQADVVLFNFLLNEMVPSETKRNNFDFYLSRTKHVSSLSACIHSIMAAEVGRKELVYDLLRQTIYMDLCDLKKNTSSGIHFACTGGAWMVVVNGLAGMRDDSRGLQFNPFIPEEWEGYSFKMQYRGRTFFMEAAEGYATYILLGGEPLTITSKGEKIRLDAIGKKIMQAL